MRKTILYMATSIDGFIAQNDGSVAWLETDPNIDLGEHNFETFMSRVDAILMGRTSYNQTLSFGDWAFGMHETYVFAANDFVTTTQNTTVVTRDCADFVGMLKRQKGKDIWCFGGGTLNHFLLENDLIDEMMIFVQPVVLGAGISLFGNKPLPIKQFDRAQVSALGGGFTMLHYSRR